MDVTSITSLPPSPKPPKQQEEQPVVCFEPVSFLRASAQLASRVARTFQSYLKAPKWVQTGPLFQIPRELLSRIFSCLTVKERAKTRAVCHTFVQLEAQLPEEILNIIPRGCISGVPLDSSRIKKDTHKNHNYHEISDVYLVAPKRRRVGVISHKINFLETTDLQHPVQYGFDPYGNGFVAIGIAVEYQGVQYKQVLTLQEYQARVSKEKYAEVLKDYGKEAADGLNRKRFTGAGTPLTIPSITDTQHPWDVLMHWNTDKKIPLLQAYFKKILSGQTVGLLNTQNQENNNYKVRLLNKDEVGSPIKKLFGI